MHMSSATVVPDDDRSGRTSVLARLRALIHGSEECSRLEVRKCPQSFYCLSCMHLAGFYARGLERTVYALRTHDGCKNRRRVFCRLGENIPGQQIISPLFCDGSFTDENCTGKSNAIEIRVVPDVLEIA